MKCATITPTRHAEVRPEEDVEEQRDHSQHPRRRHLPADRHLNIPRLVPGWTKPIVIGRHAHGDQYKATDYKVPGAGTVMMTYIPADGSEPVEMKIADFGADGGVTMGMFNYNDSIRDFARASLRYGLIRNYPVYLSTKNTILKAYDGAFKDIFDQVFRDEFKAEFDAAGLTYDTA